MIVYEASKIASCLYQGGMPPPGDGLARNGINVLVLCAADNQKYASEYLGVEVVCAPGDDSSAWPINENHLSAWKDAADIVVQRVKEGKQVLVTCMQGLNRSGIVTAMALCQLTGVSGEQAVNHIQNCRVQALCNPTFVRYIKETFPPKT